MAGGRGAPHAFIPHGLQTIVQLCLNLSVCRPCAIAARVLSHTAHPRAAEIVGVCAGTQGAFVVDVQISEGLRGATRIVALIVFESCYWDTGVRLPIAELERAATVPA